MEFKSLKGQLLLDNGCLAGSFFHHTVLLICEHNTDGAFGLMLNRPAEANALNTQMARDLIKLFVGGPVQPGAMSFLHADDFLPEANVLPNLHLEHSLDELIDLSESFSATRRLKVFAGYAGWSPGQLDAEMQRDTWLTHPATTDLVFHAPAHELWPMILRQMGWKYRLLAQQPEDPAAN